MKITIIFDDIPEDSKLYLTYKSHKIGIEYNDVVMDTVELNNDVSEVCNEHGLTLFKYCKVNMGFDYYKGVNDNEKIK